MFIKGVRWSPRGIFLNKARNRFRLIRFILGCPEPSFQTLTLNFRFYPIVTWTWNSTFRFDRNLRWTSNLGKKLRPTQISESHLTFSWNFWLKSNLKVEFQDQVVIGSLTDLWLTLLDSSFYLGFHLYHQLHSLSDQPGQTFCRCQPLWT